MILYLFLIIIFIIFYIYTPDNDRGYNTYNTSNTNKYFMRKNNQENKLGIYQYLTSLSTNSNIDFEKQNVINRVIYNQYNIPTNFKDYYSKKINYLINYSNLNIINIENIKLIVNSDLQIQSLIDVILYDSVNFRSIKLYLI